jgi:hypothetical protein
MSKEEIEVFLVAEVFERHLSPNMETGWATAARAVIAALDKHRAEKALEDIMLHGVTITQGGKRVDPRIFTLRAGSPNPSEPSA